MDLKARSKAANIVFSILILILIFLPILGFIPISDSSRLSFFTFSELRYDGVLSSKEYLMDEWKTFFDLLDNFNALFEHAPATACGYLLLYGSFAISTIAIGIFYFVNLIICLVKTVKGFSGKSETCEVTKPLMAIAASMFTYFGILYSRVGYLAPELKLISCPGVQPMFMLGCGILMVIICIILHASKRNEKPVSKVFEIVIAVLSLVFVVLFLSLPTRADVNQYGGLIYSSSALLMSLDYFTDGKSFVIGIVVATFVLGVAFSFLCQLAQAAFGDTPTSKRKKDDYPRSLVTKSALFLAFSLVGFGALLPCYLMLNETNHIHYGLSPFAYTAFALSFVFLGLAIANRVIRNKTEQELAMEPAKEEEPVQKTEETPKEPVKEEPKPEVQSGPKFCPYCGSQTIPGKKFCTNCGAKLIEDPQPEPQPQPQPQPEQEPARPQTSQDKIEELSEKIAEELEKRAEGK